MKTFMLTIFFSLLSFAAHAQTALTVNEPSLYGNFEMMKGEDGCKGGHSLCEYAKIEKVGNKAVLILDGDEKIELKQAKNVMVFSKDIEQDCDDPGCSNILSVSGVVYKKKIGKTWKTTVKATFTIDFPYPESDEDYQGEQKSTVHLIRK